MVDLHVRAVGSDNTILAAGNRKIETPRDSGVPTISGADKFSDRTDVTITATTGAIIYYTTDDTVPTNGIEEVRHTDYADRDDYDPGNCDRRWSYHE